MTHGIFASVVFSMLVSIAVFTSRGRQPDEAPHDSLDGERRLRRLSLAVVGLIFCQIVLGAVVRHQYSIMGQRGHLLLAFAVVAGVAWLVRESASGPLHFRPVKVAAIILAVLIAGQLLLGVEAWMLRYLAPSHPAVQALVRTSHVLVGHLSLATAVVVAIHVHRATASSNAYETLHAGRLEGVA
jgi:cytochrome c oxidase assembly protein subunit 15